MAGQRCRNCPEEADVLYSWLQPAGTVLPGLECFCATKSVASAELDRMRASRTLTVFAVFVIAGSILPVTCLGLSANIPPGSGGMQGGCHGHHGPVHCPIRSCCYTQHPQPVALKTAISPQPVLDALAGSIAMHDVVEPVSRFTPKVDVQDSSPPLSTVLRI